MLKEDSAKEFFETTGNPRVFVHEVDCFFLKLMNHPVVVVHLATVVGRGKDVEVALWGSFFPASNRGFFFEIIEQYKC